MKKRDFLSELELRLGGLPERDRKKSLDYYAEMIDDRMEEGISEEEAVAAMGTPAQLAEEIIGEKLADRREMHEDAAKEVTLAVQTPSACTALEKAADAGGKKSGRMSATVILLLILGSPVWLSLLLAAAVVVLSLYAVLWSVVASVLAVEVSIGACALALTLLSPIQFAATAGVSSGLAYLGLGLFLAGLGMAGFFACRYSIRGGVKLSVMAFRAIKGCFVRREASK